mgnify:CR=1 FL=1
MDGADRVGEPVGRPDMRPAHAAIAAAGLLVMALAISAGGHRLAAGETTVEIDAPEDPLPDPDALPSEDDAAGPEAPEAKAQAGVVALERVAPRAPLSELALAAPAKPKQPPRAPDAAQDWKGEPLFQPVAPAAGEIESNGVAVVISGIEVTPADETCTDDAGRNWACGLRARTAFRAFLRSRAVTCGVPEADSRPATAQCSLGNKDIGLWLVENGWARAAAGGPYAEAGDKARAAGKGIFGPAPDLSSLPPEPSIVVAPLPGPDQPSSILDLSGTAATPPAASPATPLQVFPPAPGR